jgi:hypothetical protein
MRRSVMTAGDGGRITIETGDTGTDIVGADGVLVASHGSDRHDEMVAIRQEQGWRLTEDEQVRPPEAAGTPPPPQDGEGDGVRELDLGISS